MRLMNMKIEKGLVLPNDSITVLLTSRLLFGNVMYGWSYDEFVRDEERKVKDEERNKCEEEPPLKRKRSENIKDAGVR